MRKTPFLYLLPALAILAATPSTSQAAIVETAYEFEANNFLDSNANPPATFNHVAAEFFVTYDTSQPSQLGLTSPFTVEIFSVTDGLQLFMLNENNSGVDVSIDTAAQTGRITFGGKVNGIANIAPGTNDFLLVFDVDLTDAFNGVPFDVTSIVQPFSYVLQNDPIFTSTFTNAKILTFNVIPIPSTLPMIVLGGFFIRAFTRRKTDATNL